MGPPRSTVIPKAQYGCCQSPAKLWPGSLRTDPEAWGPRSGQNKRAEPVLTTARPCLDDPCRPVLDVALQGPPTRQCPLRSRPPGSALVDQEAFLVLRPLKPHCRLRPPSSTPTTTQLRDHALPTSGSALPRSPACPLPALPINPGAIAQRWGLALHAAGRGVPYHTVP